MEKLKSRNEMDKRFMWELSHIYKDMAAYQSAYDAAKQKIAKLPAFEGTLASSAQALQAALDARFDAMHELTIVYTYAMLNKSGDNGDSEYQAMIDRCMSLIVAFGASTAYFDPEILSIPEEKINEYMKAPGLETYRHYILNLARSRAHTLDKAREEMLAKLSDAAQAPHNAFSMLESVDMTFPDVINEKGESAQLTHGSFGVYRESLAREVRKDAFCKYHDEFRRYINTFTALYAGSVKYDTFMADVRKFSSAREMHLFENNVPESVYDSLLSGIHESLPIMRKYIELRKKALKLDEIHMYDLYNPMMEDVDFSMPFEEGKKLVKKALSPLGERYQKLLDEAYTNAWIDVYENKGKTTGAFSAGCYGVHSFVLLNYTNTLDDAFTLAHELGHAMHSYLSCEKQDFANHDYCILVAEVASTVNEVLLTKYLLATEKDAKKRAYILNHFLEGFRTTVFRQTMFAEFEHKAHLMQQNGEPLTAKSLNSLYRSLNETYYEGAVVDDFIEVEWARIPHFYRPFYVYQYATGFSSAVAIASNIIKTGDASDYLKFLTTGGSDYPLEELKIAGVDLTKPETVKSAMQMFNDTIDELSALLSEIN